MAKESESRAAKKAYEMVSFRIAIKYYEQLDAYAKTQHDDESGTPLTPSLAARRLLIAAIEHLPKKKS